MKTPRINSTIKKFSLLIIVVSTTIMTATGIARADGILTDTEQAIGDDTGVSLCEYLDVAGVNNTSITKVIEIFHKNIPAMSGDNIADVVNYAVTNYCPRHWDSLVAFGEGYRSGSYA